MDWDSKTELNKSAIAILRVSSKRQEQNTSLQSQELEIERYAQEHGLAVKQTFKISESAKDSSDRKKYKEAIRFALKNRVRHVLFYMNDRETRNLTDLERNETLVKQGRLVIHHVQDRKVFHKNSSVSDILARNFTGIINKDYSLRLSVKVNRGTLAKAEMGIYPGSHPPLGYVNQRAVDANGREARRGIAKIVPDPDKNRIKQVQREFELRAEGHSLNAIRHQIRDEGFTKDGKLYPKSALEKRLKHKFYWGYFDWQGREYKGKHPLIIPAKILSAVKRSFESKDYSTKPLGKVANFGRWMRCAEPECGMTVIHDPKKKWIQATGEIKEFSYYRCSNSRRTHNSLAGMSLSEDQVIDQLSEAVRKSSITEDFATLVRKAIEVVHERSKERTRAEMAEFKRH